MQAKALDVGGRSLARDEDSRGRGAVDGGVGGFVQAQEAMTSQRSGRDHKPLGVGRRGRVGGQGRDRK